MKRTGHPPRMLGLSTSQATSTGTFCKSPDPASPQMDVRSAVDPEKEAMGKAARQDDVPPPTTSPPLLLWVTHDRHAHRHDDEVGFLQRRFSKGFGCATYQGTAAPDVLATYDARHRAPARTRQQGERSESNP